MNFSCENFIGIFENAFSEAFCDIAIKYFETVKEHGFTHSRKKQDLTNRTRKDDECVFTTGESVINILHSRILNQEFNEVFWRECYPLYRDEYDILCDFNEHYVRTLKIQKTKIGGGYHVWHCENSRYESNHRIMAFILYLNDVQEGGETEFLYYPKRIKPKAGTLILFPAHYTHTHRGNPPISNEKYIITGWVEF